MACNIKIGMYCYVQNFTKDAHIYGIITSIKIVDNINQAYVNVFILESTAFHIKCKDTVQATIKIENTQLSEEEIKKLNKLRVFS